MRTMLRLYEKYAYEYIHSVVFDGNKSKCNISHPDNTHISRFKEVSFSLSGSMIENVDNYWLRLCVAPSAAAEVRGPSLEVSPGSRSRVGGRARP